MQAKGFECEHLKRFLFPFMTHTVYTEAETINHN